ncbi:LysM peptidoglycan-binding domain-containing protein [Salinispirillum marinum]|uniref:LysM peptidoglycan-binding domain-containing protein n=2 Tax=Saccharospirillaceae TaxID=255527 RepID=A0ABV8BCY2_9GAMM
MRLPNTFRVIHVWPVAFALTFVGCQTILPDTAQVSDASPAIIVEPTILPTPPEPVVTEPVAVEPMKPVPIMEINPPVIERAVLAPAPEYAEDHILEDVSLLFPERFNTTSAFDWPRQLSAYERDLWHEMRSRFTMNLDIDDARVDAELRWYSRNQGYFDRVANRARRYLPYVYQEILNSGLPIEIALLPVVESAYDPFAYSHGRASGMWQFIPGTGTYYGLKQDWWYDGRRDVVASTGAAIAFLQDLGRQFDGDWELALASYNSGAGTVRRAQRINRERGRPTDFWHLNLPAETRAYVPKMIALARIVADPSAYGLTLPVMSTDPYFDVVDIEGQMDLAQAARLADISLDELYLLNPGYNQWATHPDGPHYLLVPKEAAPILREELAYLPPEQRVNWARYQIRPGDSLITIARAHQTTVEVLQDVNNLRGSIIRAGDHLFIPTATAASTEYRFSADQRLDRRQNQAPGNGLERIDYVVQAGDSFWELSRTYNVNLRQLAQWNGKAPTDPIIVGDTLVIWTTPDRAAQMQVSTGPASRSVIRRVGYTVRNGDSLHRIADRFNVSVNQIQRWNPDAASRQYLQPGQSLTLYVDVTNGPQ